MKYEQIIYDVANKLDYKKIHEVMVILDWHWASSNGVPNQGELFENACYLLNSAYQEFQDTKVDGWIATGGFRSYCGKGADLLSSTSEDPENVDLRIAFEISEADNYQ